MLKVPPLALDVLHYHHHHLCPVGASPVVSATERAVFSLSYVE